MELEKGHHLHVYNTLTVCVYAAILRQQQGAPFSFRSIIDATLPILQPIANAAEYSRCNALKDIFGISYQKMQANNASLHEELNIDYITKEGNVKYNLTATKRIKKLVQDAEKIVVLIHGFLESSDGIMVQSLAPEMIKQKGYKIFALDGRKIFNLEYFRSSTYARFMGERLGQLLGHLIQGGEDPSKIYLIGHSLGGHIAGMAGKQVLQMTGKLLGRITGLDPAGPCFSSSEPDGRLDKTDAVYVDIIHTSRGLLGIKEPVGHKDFYPNGGSAQPGCLFYICDHSRAWEFLADSIISPNNYPARKCDNWTQFKDGKCTKNEIAFMGVSSDDGPPGSYFLTTGPSPPFGLGPAGSG